MIDGDDFEDDNANDNGSFRTVLLKYGNDDDNVCDDNNAGGYIDDEQGVGGQC